MTRAPIRRCARRLAIVAMAALVAHSSSSTSAAFSSTTENAVNTLTAASSFYRARVMADAPIAYWRLGETSGTTAVDEKTTVNGTYAGGYSLGIAGPLVNDTNKAVDLNGTSGRVDVPDVPALRLSSKVSIEAWVKPDTLTGSRWIVNRGTLYYLYIDAGSTYFGVRAPGGTYPYAITTTVTAGPWQHLVGTYDGANVILYRNGVNVAQTAAAGTIDAAAHALTLGSFSSAANFFDGSIDEVAIYGSALSAAVVLEHYRRGALTQ
jgi:hypothetical protein